MVLLTIAEVAAQLRVHKTTAFRWAVSGFLPAIKVGRRRVVDAAELKAWIDARRNPDFKATTT